MKKRIIPFLSLIVLLAGTFLAPSTALAQAVTPTAGPGDVTATPLPATGGALAGTELPGLVEGPDVVTFEQLERTDEVLRGPFDSARIQFGIPINWQLSQGATIQLVINNAFSSTEGVSTEDLIRMTGAALDVTYNNKYITNILLDWTGEKVVEIQIPPDALVSPRDDGRQELFLFLDAALDCDFEHQTVITLRSSSRFDLPHTFQAPNTDLSLFPRPMFQEDIIFPDSVTVVTPDQPTEGEVQAALTVAAGLGRLTFGQMQISTLPVGQVTEDVLSASHLVFVGRGTAFPALSGVSLPGQAGGDGYVYAGMDTDDGIVQEIVSPWNESKLALIVGGNTDTGIVKAAQAISSGAMRTSDQPNVVLVSDVESSIETTSVSVDRTFADLGYVDEVMTGMGVTSRDYLFFVPPGQVTNDEAYLDLMYSHSALLDFELSGMVVRLNRQNIGSALFSEETASAATQKVRIPPELLRPGMNRLTLEADHIPYTRCSTLITNNLWTAISSASLLHIPLNPAVVSQGADGDLGEYPDLLATDPTLANIAFVVGSNDAASLDVAGKFAYQLGRRSLGNLVELTTYYGNPVPEEVSQTHNLILVGLPSSLPILQDLSDTLPAPFEDGSNLAQESGFRVVYRLPDGASLGYLELMESPWNSNYTVLAILGSTPEGLQWAGNTYVEPTLQGRLGGDFAVVRGEQILTSDSRVGAGTGGLSVTAAPAGVVSEPVPAPVQDMPGARPGWVLPTLIVAIVLLLAIIVVVSVSSSRRASR
ncbi:MAG: cellulose biosynthesis cyclic di-GMP-binding regulatory protein BcsB [Chloroflexi bacterium]|nr:cellulose biosynthesis cyclic di-GMP-binding regulatory protein BcsB [Chloroflexota bacterium]